MRVFNLLFALIFTSQLVSAQNNPDSLIKKLKVKQVSIELNKKQVGFFKYTNDGKEIYYMYDNFASSTFLKTSSTNIFDDAGVLVQTKSTRSSFPNDTTTWKYYYNNNGKLKNIIDNHEHIVFDYTYDSLGNKTKESMPNSAGKIQRETFYKYDRDGRLIEEAMDMGDFGNRINKTYYNELGKEIKGESIQNNKVRFATTYTYDPNTQLLVKKTYDEDGTGSRLDGVIYKYDARKRLTGRLHFDLLSDKEVITGEEYFKYFDNDLIKEYNWFKFW